MKITFWREGSANNSSSSHSIIFTKKELGTTETSEFGWDFFTAADKESKLNYAVISLYSDWHTDNSIYGCKNISYSDIDEFRQTQFKRWFSDNFVKFHVEIDNWNDIFDGYVDHQSAFTFPRYRDLSKGINTEFAKAWINELLKDEYKVLGGNDNTDEVHPNKFDGEINDFIRCYDMFCESDRDTIAVFDESTDEWVISSKSGLFKIKL